MGLFTEAPAVVAPQADDRVIAAGRFCEASFLRQGRQPSEEVAVVCNSTPVPRHNCLIGVPHRGTWQELLNSDASLYGDREQGNFGGVVAAPITKSGHPYLLTITVPPPGMVVSSRPSGA